MDENAEERTYLTPRELDFRRDERVTALGDDRYLVVTDDGASDAPESPRPTRADGGVSGASRPASASSEANAATLETSAANPEPEPTDSEVDAESSYFVSLAARTDEGTFETRVEGDDIGAVCASMLRWYANRVSPHDDPREVLSVLLSRSEFDL